LKIRLFLAFAIFVSSNLGVASEEDVKEEIRMLKQLIALQQAEIDSLRSAVANSSQVKKPKRTSAEIVKVCIDRSLSPAKCVTCSQNFDIEQAEFLSCITSP